MMQFVLALVVQGAQYQRVLMLCHPFAAGVLIRDGGTRTSGAEAESLLKANLLAETRGRGASLPANKQCSAGVKALARAFVANKGSGNARKDFYMNIVASLPAGDYDGWLDGSVPCPWPDAVKDFMASNGNLIPILSSGFGSKLASYSYVRLLAKKVKGFALFHNDANTESSYASYATKFGAMIVETGVEKACQGTMQDKEEQKVADTMWGVISRMFVQSWTFRPRIWKGARPQEFIMMINTPLNIFARNENEGTIMYKYELPAVNPSWPVTMFIVNGPSATCSEYLNSPYVKKFHLHGVCFDCDPSPQMIHYCGGDNLGATYFKH